MATPMENEGLSGAFGFISLVAYIVLFVVLIRKKIFKSYLDVVSCVYFVNALIAIGVHLPLQYVANARRDLAGLCEVLSFLFRFEHTAKGLLVFLISILPLFRKFELLSANRKFPYSHMPVLVFGAITYLYAMINGHIGALIRCEFYSADFPSEWNSSYSAAFFFNLWILIAYVVSIPITVGVFRSPNRSKRPVFLVHMIIYVTYSLLSIPYHISLMFQPISDNSEADRALAIMALLEYVLTPILLLALPTVYHEGFKELMRRTPVTVQENREVGDVGVRNNNFETSENSRPCDAIEMSDFRGSERTNVANDASRNT